MTIATLVDKTVSDSLSGSLLHKVTRLHIPTECLQIFHSLHQVICSNGCMQDTFNLRFGAIHSKSN